MAGQIEYPHWRRHRAADNPRRGHESFAGTGPAARRPATASGPGGTSSGPDIPPRIVRPADVGGPVAWWDLVRHGAIRVVLDDAAVPRDTAVDRWVRAAAIAPRVPRGSTLAGLGAAWVLAGGAAPTVVETIHAPGRHRPMPTRRLHPRQALLLRDETLVLAGLRVTTALRTALDLATFAPPAEAHAALRRLVSQCGLDLDAAQHTLDLRYRWPGRERAQRRLAAACAPLCEQP